MGPRPEGLCLTVEYVAGGYSLHSQKVLNWKGSRAGTEARPPFPAENNLKGRPNLILCQPFHLAWARTSPCASQCPHLPSPCCLFLPHSLWQLWKLELRMVRQFYHLLAGSSPLLLLWNQTPVFHKWDKGSRAQVHASPQTSLGISVGGSEQKRTLG